MDRAGEQTNQWTNPRLSQTLAIGVIIAFLFPFVTVSCQGQEVATITGVQFAIGGPIEAGDGVVDSSGEDRVDREFSVLVAAVIAAASAIVAFVRAPGRTSVLILLGLGGAVSLVLFRVSLASDVAELRSAGAVVTYAWGWWLALAGFAGLVVVNGVSDSIGALSQDTLVGGPVDEFLHLKDPPGLDPPQTATRDPDAIRESPVEAFLRPKDLPDPDPPPAAPSATPEPAVDRFCRNCGARFDPQNRFCGSCGAARGAQ